MSLPRFENVTRPEGMAMNLQAVLNQLQITDLNVIVDPVNNVTLDQLLKQILAMQGWFYQYVTDNPPPAGGIALSKIPVTYYLTTTYKNTAGSVLDKTRAVVTTIYNAILDLVNYWNSITVGWLPITLTPLNEYNQARLNINGYNVSLTAFDGTNGNNLLRMEYWSDDGAYDYNDYMTTYDLDYNLIMAVKPTSFNIKNYTWHLCPVYPINNIAHY